MSDTNFISQVTPIASTWSQDVNDAVYRAIGTGAGGSAPATPADVLTNLGISDSGGAALVGYTQGSIGSVPRTVASKLQESVSVLDFGADPTGVLDSTAAIQAAINAASNSVLFIHAGHYEYSALTVSNPITIEGAGYGKTFLNTTNATGDTISVTGAHVKISGLTFGSNVSRTSGAYVHATSTANAFVMNDFEMYSYFIGVQMDVGGRLTTAEFFNGVPASVGHSAGILIAGGADQYINKVTMESPGGSSQPYSGIHVVQTDNMNITDCDIINHGTDLLIDPGNGQTVVSVWALNSYFDTANIGIMVNPTGTGSVVRSHFIGCWTGSQSIAGVEIYNQGTGLLDGIDFIGHHSMNNAGPAFSLVKGDRLRFLGGAAAGNAEAAFSIQPNVSNFSIIGMDLGNGYGFGGNQYAVYINAGTSDNFIIRDNVVTGNTLGTILDGSTGGTKQIANNMGYNPLQNTAIAVGASPFTWTNNTGDTVVVYISGGTVSGVTANGNIVANATNSSVTVPAGSNIVTTYSSAPTMSYNGF